MARPDDPAMIQKSNRVFEQVNQIWAEAISKPGADLAPAAFFIYGLYENFKGGRDSWEAEASYEQAWYCTMAAMMTSGDREPLMAKAEASLANFDSLKATLPPGGHVYVTLAATIRTNLKEVRKVLDAQKQQGQSLS
jgi:hypothetical protein